MMQQVDNKAVSTARFAGKTVLVTGGASGMGKAAALDFAAEGARVAVFDIQERAGLDTVRIITQAGGEASYWAVNVINPIEVDAAIQRVVEKYGDIDVLFNVAGTIIVKAFHDTSLDEFDLLFDVNVRSAFIVCRNVVLRMMQTGGGSIVIMSSISGHLGFAYEGVYNMTKAANLMLAKSIAAEYREFNIRANAVCPGFVDTAHGQREIAEFRQLGQNWDESALADNQGRICDPREVARAALFLASDDASFINGTGLLVDNGWHAIG